jgi:hypothetical protein
MFGRIEFEGDAPERIQTIWPNSAKNAGRDSFVRH